MEYEKFEQEQAPYKSHCSCKVHQMSVQIIDYTSL